MVSSACRGSYSAPQPRKLNIDPHKDYLTPLHVETSVEYDLPAHIYPPKGAEPILMINPAYANARRSRSVNTVPQVNTPNRSINNLQPVLNSSRSISVSSGSNRKGMCSCGVMSCNLQLKPLSSSSSQRNSANSVINSSKSVQYRDQELYSIRLSQQQKKTEDHTRQIQQNSMWGANTNRCLSSCCMPRTGAMAPVLEFAQPGMPPSLMTRTPARGSSGGSPKLRTTVTGRSRRGLNLASSANLPEYLGTSRSSRMSVATAAHPHQRPRAVSTTGALAAAPAPPMAHQTMGVSLTTSLDLARTNQLASRSMYASSQAPQTSISQLTSSALLSTVGLSRDSGCSVGDTSMNSFGPTGLDWTNTSDWSRSLVDSGFCTPVDITSSEECLLTGDMNSIGSAQSSSTLPNLSSNGTLLSNTPSYPYSSSSSVNSTNNSFTSLKEAPTSWKEQLSPWSFPSTPVHASFLAPSHPNYLPTWNLVY